MALLRAIVLGAAAGGGFPQWNCRCPGCTLAWAGDPRVTPRTQASLAVTADGERWVLINAAPDLPEQIRRTPALHPAQEPRSSPIKAVVLTGAEIDQITGLLSLRERQPLLVFATTETLGRLQANPVFDALDPHVVDRWTLPLDTPVPLPGKLRIEAFAVPGKLPLYAEDGDPAPTDDATVGLMIRSGDRTLAYVPGAAALPPDLVARLAAAEAVLFDGTLFTDDEMIRAGVGKKTGRRMGHIPIAGEDGSLRALAALPGRRIYTHINNTNPILVEGSDERRTVEAAGWEIAWDGMEIVL